MLIRMNTALDCHTIAVVAVNHIIARTDRAVLGEMCLFQCTFQNKTVFS